MNLLSHGRKMPAAFPQTSNTPAAKKRVFWRLRRAVTATVVTSGMFAAAAGYGVANAADAAATRYTLDPAKSTFEYQFTQAGALNKGKFTKYTVTLDFSADSLATSKLDVVVDMASLDTGDKERDETLKSADLFSVAKFPQSRFTSTQITKTANGYDAVGKLTIRGVSHDAHIPFTFKPADGSMLGKTTVKRLDYGVGQGDWKATDQVGNDVAVSYALRLVPAAH
jgi:polyisoprenoid-binding protein YceI